MENKLKDLIERGGEVVACNTRTFARGLTQRELIDGIIIGSTVGDLARWIKKRQKVLTY